MNICALPHPPPSEAVVSQVLFNLCKGVIPVSTLSLGCKYLNTITPHRKPSNLTLAVDELTPRS